MGGTVITTNGCFDILHVGHLRMLEHAKRNLGNYNLLLVGVNTDDSVRRLKGGDYTQETLPEWDTVVELGGEVKIIPTVGNYSTTGVLERI